MRRSWLALCLVLVVIAVLVIVQLSSRPGTPSDERETRTETAKAPSAKAVLEKLAPPPPPPKKEEPAKKGPEEPPKPRPLRAEDVLKEAEARVADGKLTEAQALLSEALTGAYKVDNPDTLKARLAELQAKYDRVYHQWLATQRRSSETE